MEISTTKTNPPKLERFASIDLLRGIALFCNILVHLFTDVFDTGVITSNLSGLPLNILLLFVAIGYFGSYGSGFVMISGTGNMISMHTNLEKGKSPRKVVSRQIVGGIILLIFCFLVEGTFQFYGYFGTFFAMNGHAYDPTRIIWHAYSMTPVTCLAVGMIVTGIIEIFLSARNGHRKVKRNIVIYIILSIIVLVLSQPVWNYCKSLIPGFPNAHISTLYPGDYGDKSDWRVYMPPPTFTAQELISYFFLAILGGSNHPIFPFLVMSFVGNIIGILLVDARNQPRPDPHIPRKGMLSAIGIFLFGVIMIPILGVDFGSILPVDHIGDITGIHNGLEAFWLPWWCFLLAGEVFIIFLTLRLIEYRGNGEQVASKTTFVRRFGIPAFSVYSWHRFWVTPLIMLLTWIFGQPSWLGGSIVGASLNWWQTIITLVLVQFVCGLILFGWEKIGYIGGVEWMMAEFSALFGPNMRKTKGTTKTHAKWWEYGRMDVEALFYHPHWIDIIKRDEKYIANKSDSKFALKLSITGLFTGFLAFFAFVIALNARRKERPNSYNRKALVISTFGILLVIVFLVVTSFLTLDQFGISL